MAFETQFGTNHLGQFVLVTRIVSLMRAGSRLINLASAGHRFSNVDLDDPNFERTPLVNVSFSNSRVLVNAREFSREDCARDFVRRWPIFHSAVGLAFGSSLLQRVLAGLPLRTVPDQSL